MKPDEGPDLLVAGAGGGLAGALRAHGLGLSVLVVEAGAAFRRSNNTSMSTAMIPGPGSRFQREAGLTDSPETFLADVRRKTHDDVDEVVATTVAGVGARLVEWLADDIGLPIELVTDFDYPGHSVHRCHTVPGRSGASMLGMLADAVEQAGIDVLAPARLVDVAPAVDGVTVATLEYPDGSTEQIGCGAVLLATNGYGADQELVQRHIPEIAGAVYHGSEHSRGDALRIGERLGAATGYLDGYQGHGGLTAGTGTLTTWATVMLGGVVVNRDGERFADETQGYSEFARLELGQPDAFAAVVFDERIHLACSVFEDYRQTQLMNGLRSADTLAGLAEQLGVPAGSLTATLEQVATVVTGGAADPHGRTGWPAAPLQGPWYGVRVQPALFHTQGGLRVDDGARVLDGAGAPIPGLYAAGGAAVGISGHGPAGYLAGNGLLTALGLSFVAAETAAQAAAVVADPAGGATGVTPDVTSGLPLARSR
ncbi:FAD-binding protein [Nakamurella sp. YIM 132087]|uniref:FAD-binding protein n=1 Tax=Nakamurella alba TaxID=2665158 RepID=A0A7K1FNP7_9ACTN|nr:FAD-binding protein [Nakamurella alba]MTD15781.1 FAD-binding protein [Nakamurella alba]